MLSPNGGVRNQGVRPPCGTTGWSEMGPGVARSASRLRGLTAKQLRRYDELCVGSHPALTGVIVGNLGHDLALVDDTEGATILFCKTCGAFATKRPAKLMHPCSGSVSPGSMGKKHCAGSSVADTHRTRITLSSLASRGLTVRWWGSPCGSSATRSRLDLPQGPSTRIGPESLVLGMRAQRLNRARWQGCAAALQILTSGSVSTTCAL